MYKTKQYFPSRQTKRKIIAFKSIIQNKIVNGSVTAGIRNQEQEIITPNRLENIITSTPIAVTKVHCSNQFSTHLTKSKKKRKEQQEHETTLQDQIFIFLHGKKTKLPEGNRTEREATCSSVPSSNWMAQVCRLPTPAA